MSTCQICGRNIKSNTGVIAHHGYRRPHNAGWQTASCMGARHLPYEESCDVLPKAIESVQAFINAQTMRLDAMITNPPATLKFKRHGFGTVMEDAVKPEGFKYNPSACYNMSQHYELAYHREVYAIEQNIKFAGFQLTYLQDRLNNWTSPTGESK